MLRYWIGPRSVAERFHGLLVQPVARLQHLLEALAVEQIKLRRACLETARGPGRAAALAS